MAVVAGVDSSTQSTKVELRDAESGDLLGRATAPHPPTSPPRSEQDPEAWWTAFQRCWSQLGEPSVGAISVAGQQHGMVVLDADGAVLRPAKLWNDTESAPDAGWLLQQLEGGPAAWAAACGSVPVAAFTVTKLSWLHRIEPDHWARVAKVLLPHDWLTFRLSGRFTTDRGDASGTGYWSPAEGAYRWDLLRIVDSDRDWYGGRPRGARTPRRRRSLAIGGRRPRDGRQHGRGPRSGRATRGRGRVHRDVGDGVRRERAAHRRPERGGRRLRGRHGPVPPLVCTLNATKVTEAVRNLLAVDHEGLDALALAARPGAGGLTLLPVPRR